MHNKALHKLYFWPDIISIMSKKRSCSPYGKEDKLFQNLGRKTKDKVIDAEVDGRIILEWIIKKQDVRV